MPWNKGVLSISLVVKIWNFVMYSGLYLMRWEKEKINVASKSVAFFQAGTRRGESSKPDLNKKIMLKIFVPTWWHHRSILWTGVKSWNEFRQRWLETPRLPSKKFNTSPGFNTGQYDKFCLSDIYMAYNLWQAEWWSKLEGQIRSRETSMKSYAAQVIASKSLQKNFSNKAEMSGFRLSIFR